MNGGSEPNSIRKWSLRSFKKILTRHYSWGSCQNSISCFDKASEQFTHYADSSDFPHFFNHNSVWFMAREKDGMFWLGTFGGGLKRFDAEANECTTYRAYSNEAESYARYSALEGLLSDYIFGILVCDHNQFWINTLNGLCRFRPQIFRNGTVLRHRTTMFLHLRPSSCSIRIERS